MTASSVIVAMLQWDVQNYLLMVQFNGELDDTRQQLAVAAEAQIDLDARLKSGQDDLASITRGLSVAIEAAQRQKAVTNVLRNKLRNTQTKLDRVQKDADLLQTQV
jgi:hypothetical protein